jgi:putative DNA primase/helicase
MSNAAEGFKRAMHDAGIEPPADIIADSELHRFTVPGDKSRSDNGWYCFHADEPAAGAFGCWKRGISGTWCSMEPSTMTATEKAGYSAKLEAMKRQREADRQAVQAECRKKSAELWQAAHDIDAEHLYIKAKQIKPYGVKQLKESLLVPVRNSAGNLNGLQFIGPDGVKKFKTGTAVAGCYLSIGKPNGKVLIAEGYATGATLHEVTGQAVAVAFDCGNLKPVAAALRAKYPALEIIICGDDDHGTDGNPGLTKATEAARAVNGLLAVPVFPDNRGPKDSDFNDMARLSGAEIVRACIDQATAFVTPSPCTEAQKEAPPVNEGNPLDAAIQRLAALSPLKYDQVRKTEAKALGVRPGTLDAVVKAARKGNDNDDLPFTEVDPWAVPVDPARLLSDIALTIRRFIVCTEEVSHAVALWAAMTWFIDVVQVAPLAIITAPEKRCGKSQLLFLLGLLSARAITASSISPAALFRTIDAWKPTLFIDEVDALLKDNEELRGLLNSGHTRDSAYVIRTVGESFTPTKFNTWGAKALARIGHVADTLMDRAVILELRRKLPHESVERVRYAGAELFNDLRSKLARFAEDYSDQVKQARPPLPYSLNDRAQDNWEPLLAIAMTASNEWLQIGTTAALKLSGGESASQTIGVELLSDIQEIFEGKEVDRISTVELIKALCDDEEKTWATYNRGKWISPRQVAKKLKGYGIQSKTIRIGLDTPKGYDKEQFAEAFLRYIPSTPENIRHTPQSAPVFDLSVADNQQRCGNKTEKETLKPATVLSCGGVADKNPLPEENIFDLSEEDLKEVTFA